MKRICLFLMLLVLLLTGCSQEEPATVATISPGPVSVTVGSVDELLAAIDHNTEILLEPGCYDLSTTSDYGKETNNPCYAWVALSYTVHFPNVQNFRCWIPIYYLDV